MATASGCFKVGTDLVQYGYVKKTFPGPLTISFPIAFSSPPCVTVTPFWPNGPVSFVETITDIDKSYFTINSGNSFPNYGITWQAMGS